MDAQDVIRRVNLLDLVRQAGGRVHEKANGVGYSNCPLHDGNSVHSFSVYRTQDGTQRWHCFSKCRTGGDAIEFVIRWQKTDFRQAVEFLQGWVGTADMPIEELARSTSPQHPSDQWQDRAQAFVAWAQDKLWAPDGERGMNYLTDRGLSEMTIGMHMLGWCPRTWQDMPEKWGLTGKPVTIPSGVIIPCWRDGLWYVKARRLSSTGPKYVGIRGGSNTLYGCDLLTRDARPLLIVEGEFDRMIVWQECRKVVDVVAMPGAAQHLSLDDLCLLSTRRNVWACLDTDDAGKAGLRYLQSVTGGLVVAVSPPSGHHDLNEAYLAGEDLQTWSESLCLN